MEREKDKSQSTKTEDAGLPPKMSNSADLAVEEEFAKLTIQYENLLKRNADQRTSNESLRYHNEQLLATLREKQEEIKQLSGSSSEETNMTYIQNLRNRIQEQEDIIARLEYEVKDNNTSTGKQEKELANLRPLTRRVQDLQDSISELQNANALLTKKANKVDRYEEKLRNAAVLEKEMARLREQNATLERNQATFDEVHEHNRRLDSETAAYRKKMEQYELEFHEHQRRISFLEEECHAKDIKLRELNAKELADEQHIHELEEQVKMVPNVPRSPNSPSTATRGLNLEAELEQSEGHHPNYTLEIARLKAENQLLKSDSAGTSNATLRVELETAARLQKRLESQIQELTEKHAIGQEQLNAVMSSDMGEKLVPITNHLMQFGPLQILTTGFYRNEAIANIRRLWLDATRELTATKTRLEDLQLKLTDRDRQLLTVKADRKF
jgi:protein HOOK3